MITRQELVDKAKALGIQGTSKMNMTALQAAIENIESNSNIKEENIVEKEKVMMNGVEMEVQGDLDLEESIPAPGDAEMPADFIEEGSSSFVPVIPNADAPAANVPNTSALLCPNCKGEITKGIINFCLKNYPGKTPVCMDCQKKLNYAGNTDDVQGPPCPHCNKKTITPTIKKFCDEHYPGKTPVCVQCQKDLKYVDVLKGVNTGSDKIGVCCNDKCSRKLSALEGKFNAIYAEKLGGKKYCFNCAPKDLVLDFNKNHRGNNTKTNTPTNTSANPIANTPVMSYEELTNFRCECHGKQLTRAEVYRCKRLWIKRPEFEGVYLCLGTIIDKGLIADCK